jgi:hypothetical protein
MRAVAVTEGIRISCPRSNNFHVLFISVASVKPTKQLQLGRFLLPKIAPFGPGGVVSWFRLIHRHQNNRFVATLFGNSDPAIL